MVDEIDERKFKRVQHLANLEAIRTSRYHQVMDRKEMIGGINETVQSLKLDPFEPGWIYVITNIAFQIIGSSGKGVELGVEHGGVFHIFNARETVDDYDTVEYVGELICGEGDKIRGDTRSVGSTDTIRLCINGFKIKF